MSHIFADIHNHLLPGIDDGPLTLKESSLLASACMQAGTKTVICTPHLIPGEWDNTRSRVLPAVDDLRRELKSAGIPLEILPGAEAMVHPSLIELHTENELPTLGDHGIHLLLEMPWNFWPEGIEDLIFDLRQRGLEIIIAHPERYGPVRKDPSIVRRWVEQGLMMQVTARSLTSSRSTTGALARHLVEDGLVHFIASDSHSAARSPALGPALDLLAHRYGDQARVQALENAAAVAAGSARQLPPLPIQKKRRRWFWWRK